MKGEITVETPWKDPLAGAILLLLLGIILLVLQSGAISLIVIVAGALLIVYGANALSRGIRHDTSGDLVIGLLGCIIGLLLIIASGLFVTLMVYILAAFLIVFGVFKLIEAGKNKGRRDVNLIVGIILVVLGVLFAVYPGATANTLMIIIGVILIIVAALSIWSYLK